MSSYQIELRTNPGFAHAFKTSAVYYGLVLHERVVDGGASTREQVRFVPFLDDDGAAVAIADVTQDEARGKLERGSESGLDRTLVRASPMRLKLEGEAPFGCVTLQRAFIVLLARKELISPALGLTLHVEHGDQRNQLDCVDGGAALTLIWFTPDWREVPAPETPVELTTIDGFVGELQSKADRVISTNEAARRQAARASAKAAAHPPPAPAVAAARPAPPPPPPRPPAPAPAPAPVPVPAPEPEPERVHAPAPAPKSGFPTPVRVTIGIGVVLVLGTWLFPTKEAPPTPAPAPMPVSVASSPPPRAVAPAPPEVIEPRIPLGNAPATRQTLYTLGFPNHQRAVNGMLTAAKAGDVAAFEQQSAWLRENRDRRSWPPADAKARRELNEQLETMINNAKAVGDRATLGRAAQVSETFLQTHFGYSVAHLNLAISQIALDAPKEALAPAFHTIVFNPDGANGYVALAVALARTNDVLSATAAFCTVLRKVKYSERTVAFFAKIARGEDFKYPEVAAAMQQTATMCPQEKWGVE